MRSGDSTKTSSDIENVEWSVGTTAGHMPNVVRFGSSSSQASQSSGDICRICHCESDPLNPLLTPCYCSGSLKYVHQACLQQWLTASETNACELCKFPFIMHTKIKPFNEWRSLDMSGVERRRLFCAVLFHCAAALCVIWSLCVLIERAAEEVKRGLIGWPFWTKLVVVTVGLTGGVVFMYIQCRQYLHLCNRWRARNRILLIQNAPEKIHQIQSSSPMMSQRPFPRNGSSSTTGNYPVGATAANLGQMYARPPSHGEIVANIENNHLNYDRDWTLDDVSQMSFKPCPQGSGSMTPLAFHDSVHNIYEQPSGNTSRSSQEHIISAPGTSRTGDLSLFKLGNASSAVFLENRDILNDGAYPKVTCRHSSVGINPLEITEGISKDTRRFSDTKLLQHSTDPVASDAIFNVTNLLGPSIPAKCDATPQITDIIFEAGSSFDPLELNIQEMLELDIQQQKKSQLSLNANSAKAILLPGETARSRPLFKSLPNLSGSSENLLQKQ
ncbi:uncharacterized protein LOC132263431 [Phlebotomus argentipes]|uniref:uncharacterized protein LOC132263431 n=1 Tax=Phlebotomus argentipes TaxID=94469 RepID=UPI002892AD5E|nr:uncharacterized protein LOC132263431 [Phlebotomus argentipes]